LAAQWSIEKKPDSVPDQDALALNPRRGGQAGLKSRMLATESTHCRERRATPTRTVRSEHQQKESEKALSLIYVVALIAVALALLAGLAEAIWSVSRKPSWGEPARELTLVETVERRKQNLPFVGRERRRAAVEPQTEVDKVAA